MAMAVASASLQLSRLSLHPSSTGAASCSYNKTLRLSSSSTSFSFNPLMHTHGVARGFSFSEIRRRPLISIVAAAAPNKKKADSAAKRARQSEKRRFYNKSRKSEIHTRMKKVFVALDGLKKQASPSQEMLLPIESMIAEAFSTIDKAVKVGTLHRNTGDRRKSRLSRAKKTIETQLGWYNPSATSSP